MIEKTVELLNTLASIVKPDPDRMRRRARYLEKRAWRWEEKADRHRRRDRRKAVLRCIRKAERLFARADQLRVDAEKMNVR
jgi:hypothetical protein